ncbi:MAG: hypothetical protein MK107_09020 [Oceanicola sp.]|nr:hypothetical protein [Oceanicola sp.]
MRPITKTAIAALLVTAAPIAASAQNVAIAYGLSFSTEYVSQGFELSDGASLGAYVEAAASGAYAGVYAQTGDPDLLGASTEFGAYIGYGNTIGSFSYDINYNYYWYDDSDDDFTEIVATGTYALTDAIYASLSYGKYLTTYEQSSISATVDYYTDYPGLTISGTYGQVESDFGFTDYNAEWNYWSLGASYTVSDNVTIDLTYYDADDGEEGLGVTEGIAVVSVMIDF